MRTRSTGACRGVQSCHPLPWLLAAAVLATAAFSATAQLPRPVSPGAVELGAISEARCPTFSWSGVAGARGYQIAVFRVSELPGDEPTLVTTAKVDGDARSFTPTLGRCLERGHRYAWTVAALPDDPSSSASDSAAGDLSWAPALLFEVEGAPSPDELERAIATLRRHLDTRQGGDIDAVAAALRDTPGVAPPLARSRSASPRDARTRPARDTAPRPPAEQPFLHGALAAGDLAAPSTATRIASAASTPTLGDASLAVSNQIHLAATSDLFKGGAVFLWDDTTGNTALGREALASVTGSADHNTAFGRGALRSTTGGGSSFHGSYNTAVGDRALYTNTTGFRNTASGYAALRSNTTGYRNTASGSEALRFNTNGTGNTASGYNALRANTTGYNNTASGSAALRANTTGYRNTATGNGALLLNTTGSLNTAGGSDALRANTTGYFNTASGSSALFSNTTGYRNTASGSDALLYNTTGGRNTALGNRAGIYNITGNYSIFINNEGSEADNATIKIGTQGTQASTFIAGISGVTVSGAAVLVDGNGQLGVASSSREVKRDISTLPPLAERLLALRPVSFRYRQLGANGEVHSDTPLEYGLVAEEVAEVLPELVIYDQNGKPQTVKYHLLGSLLLRALQEQQQTLEAQRSALDKQNATLEAQRTTTVSQQEELASQRQIADRQRFELARLQRDHRVLTKRLAALESRSRR